MEEKQKIGKDKTTSTGRERGSEGGESGEQPSLNKTSQLRQAQKTMGLLTGDWRSWEGYSTLKSHESMVENHWELCCMISYVVYDYVTLDINLRLLHNG